MKTKFSKLKKYLLGLSVLAVSTGVQAQVPLPGSGRAMLCDNTSPQAFSLGTALNDSLAFSSFTIEMWIKVDPASVAGNPPVIANKNYTSGANTGICWTYSASASGPGSGQTAGSFRFNFRANSGTRRDYDIKPANPHQWNHIAMVVDRKGELKGYVNGMYQSTIYSHPATIAADSLRSLATGALDMYLAQDGTGNYPSGYFFKGAMDEVRIWKRTLDSTEIRNNMCRRLNGNESGLLAYYRLDELPGSTTIVNSASATNGLLNGTATATAPAFVTSGAPVGDAAINLYTNAWAGRSLALNTTHRGNFIVDSFGMSTGAFLHLYQVNAAPDSINGLTGFSNNDVSFGVFAPSDTFQYYPKFEYANYPNAIAFQNTIQFFNRKFNDVLPWVGKPNLYNNTASNILRIDSVKGPRQFFLANFIGTCDDPSALAVSNINPTDASITWTTGGSGMWNLQYGPRGFALGNGTVIPAVNTNSYVLNALQGSTAYDVYVQDTCTGIGTSNWVGPVSFETPFNYAPYAAGYALQFNGNGVNNGPSYGVNLGTALRDSLAYTDFTIEMWVKVGNTNTNNPSLIASKDYVNGGNPGISWNYAAPGNSYGSAPGHTFRFNFTTQGGSRHDYDVPVANEYVWNHVAVSVNRRGEIKGYLNGVYYPNNLSGSTASPSVIADSSRSLAAGALPLYLGTDGTGNYRSPFNGQMDEVRIWKRVLSEEELRETMCHKLEGNENGLLAYYRMNEPSGTIVYNNALATTGLFNGTFTPNRPTHVVSGAPVGDTSVYIYPASGWSGASLSLAGNGYGTLTVDSITAHAGRSSISVPGIHLYRIDNVPNSSNGIADLGNTAQFFGVFTADNVAADYRVQYDYAAYSNAVANAADVHLYNRQNNAMPSWAQLPAQNNTSANVIGSTSQLGTRQYLLADFTAVTCAAPQAISLDSLNNSFASFSWISQVAAHNTKFGLTGFNPDSTAAIHLANSMQDFTNLTPNTTYDFYVQDSCGAGNNSAWVGPYTFTTDGDCPYPVNVFADSITMNSLVLKWTDLGFVTTSYGIAWGGQGTFSDPDNATYQFAFSTRHLFTALQANTTYEFYIKTFCNSSIEPNTGWVGPFSFTTAGPATGVDDRINSENDAIRVYPNPTSGKLTVELSDARASGINNVSVYDVFGARLWSEVVNDGATRFSIHTQEYASGIYHIVFTLKDNTKVHKTFVVRH